MRILIFTFLFLLITPVKAYNLDFFSKFNDIWLEEYIKEALSNNHSAKSAQHKVEQFRGEVRKTLSGEFPSLSAGANYLGTHFPNNDYNIFLKRNSFILPLKVAWELDLLLKTKDRINSAKYLYFAQNANKDSFYISLLTDVASTYVNILLYDYTIKKQQKLIENKKENLKTANKKFQYGIVDLENLNNFREDLKNAEILYNTLLKNRNNALLGFSTLIGRSGENINDIKRGNIEYFEYKNQIPKSIESSVIFKRPDIIELENKLKSAKLDITVAKKDFFPTFNISGALIFDTVGAGNFFSWGSSFAYLIAGLTQDIFKGGEKFANLKIKKNKYYELVENYAQKDLEAIKEINSALNIIKEDLKNEQESFKKLDLEQKNYKISNNKLKRGIIAPSDFLDYENSLIQKEQLFQSSKAMRLVDYFTLYKAVGGNL